MTKNELQNALDRWKVGAICRKSRISEPMWQKVRKTVVCSKEPNVTKKDTVIGLCWLPKACEYEDITIRQALVEDIEKRLGACAALDADQAYDLIERCIETDKRVIG